MFPSVLIGQSFVVRYRVRKLSMADQMNWSVDGETFPDLGTDFLNPTDFDTSSFGGVEGKLMIHNLKSSLDDYLKFNVL